MEALEGLFDFNDGIFILEVFKNEDGGRKCILGRIRVMKWELVVHLLCCLSLPLRITRLPYVIILVVSQSTCMYIPLSHYMQ